mmetsp:Transcript_114807/g.179343  ORF Transcript_114807/g.179343 Transcript_114807/m.179343 type:complete len:412 (+) Transcript_114807:95-1330(+)
MAANDYGSLEEGKKWWQKKVLSEEERMRVNGETKAQMEYAQAVKDNGGVSLKEGESRDTSQDQPWEYEDKPYTDNYVLITTAIWMLPKLIVFLPVMLILNVVPVVLCRFFMAMMPEPMDRVQRNPVFYAWFTIVLICSLPAMLVIVLSYLLDSIVYYLFSILFCTFTCQWAQAMSNFERIRPFRGGPSIITHSTDIMCCIMGQSMRQGLLEIVYMVSMMWVLIPWLKYYICCNPFIYNLDHRLVQQISTGMKDLGDLASECRSDGKGVEEVAHECRNVISRARNSRERRHRVDLWSFVPHYPYPPPGRKHSFGMQALEEKIGLHLYGDDATLSIYRQQGEKDHKDSWQAFDDRMGDCNKLGCIARKHEDGEDSCLLRPDVNDEDREEGNPMVYPETPHGGLSQTLKKHWVD